MPTARQASSRKGTEISQQWLAMFFIAPVAIYLLVFQAYPLIQELLLSFTSSSLLSPVETEFVGLENYRTLVYDPEFQQTLWVTVVYTIGCVFGAIAMGLGAALLLDAPFAGRGAARALVTIPWAAPPVAVALVGVWMFNAQYGIINHGLRAIGLDFGNWLDSPDLALPAILLTTIWQIFPFSAVVILASLQGVPKELREAATMDGANRWNVFLAVVWPGIRPTIALLSLFTTVWSLRRFDLIWLMTQGGPLGRTNTLVIDLYRRAFVYLQLGPAAAAGVIGLVIALAVTLIYFTLSTRAERAAKR
ncbi:sugar ABC transporter [Rhizobium sp. AC44/96]|uniref:carbohydrate ABC transporter permease n=1 Tax=Rhizobium sp. AC44/96 TaxID=1841654 RepID=UPI00080FCCA1|nr:sugar ABC transporter permease [Rhizobium sp. AC44/96]OCJ14432.1 sugar ABC transporter [Rhizobium sp. AC44/96]